MHIRGAICAGVLTLVVIFAIAGVATPVVTFKSGAFEGYVSLWKSCGKSGAFPETCTDLSSNNNFACSSMKDRFGAARAFCILTIIVGAFAVAVSIADLLEVLPTPELATLIMAGIFGMVWVFALLAFAIDVSIFTEKLCGGNAYKDVSGASLGPGPILMIIAWLLTFPPLAVAFILQPAPKAAEPNAPTTQP